MNKIKPVFFIVLLITGMLLVVWKWKSGSTISDSQTYSFGVHQVKNVHNTNLEMNATSNLVTTNADLSLELYLRMTTAKPSLQRYYESLLVQSMRYFWPDNFSMVVVLDYERHEDHLFADYIRQRFPFPNICYMDPITQVKYSGKDRMQRDMFYPEKCTSKKYVGFLDTDTVFTSRVIPELLFDNGKPIIIGLYGNVTSADWGMVAETTTNIFKTKEVMSCMANFPVIMKVEHLVKLREYVEKLHGMTFDEILQRKKVDFLGQFNFMCQYIWMFHRDEYTFHISFNPRGNQILAGRQSHQYYRETFTSEQLRPVARFCVHYKYYDVHGNWRSQQIYTHIFKSSMCFMGGFDLCPEKCKNFNKDSLRKEMFVFDFVDWTWDNRCMEAQQKHYRDVARYASPEYSNIIRNACNEVDTLKWEP